MYKKNLLLICSQVPFLNLNKWEDAPLSLVQILSGKQNLFFKIKLNQNQNFFSKTFDQTPMSIYPKSVFLT